MLGQRRLAQRRQRLCEQRLGFTVARLSMSDAGEAHPRRSRVMMVRTEGALVNAEGALQGVLGVCIVAAGYGDAAEPVKGGGDLGVIAPERLLADGQRAL